MISLCGNPLPSAATDPPTTCLDVVPTLHGPYDGFSYKLLGSTKERVQAHLRTIFLKDPRSVQRLMPWRFSDPLGVHGVARAIGLVQRCGISIDLLGQEVVAFTEACSGCGPAGVSLDPKGHNLSQAHSRLNYIVAVKYKQVRVRYGQPVGPRGGLAGAKASQLTPR